MNGVWLCWVGVLCGFICCVVVARVAIFAVEGICGWNFNL